MIGPALRHAAALLAQGSPTPRLDAEILLAYALGISREALLLRGGGETVPEVFAGYVARRAAGEPVAYITGVRAFWTIELAVSPDVLIPRPDSETLIEAAVEHFRGEAPRTVLDLGTGSGALLLAALDQWRHATGIGIDASEAAVRVARDNARRLGMAERADIRLGDWVGSGGPHDLVLCNPPYVAADEELPHGVSAFEPASALFAGADGLADYRRIAPVIGAQIAPGGIACIEIGASQAAPVGALFAGQGFSVRVRQDLAGRDRCLMLHR